MNKNLPLDNSFFNFQDLDRTELMWSIIDNNKDLFDILVKDISDKDLNQKTNDGRTAIMYAALYNRMDMLKVLYNKGAEYYSYDKNKVDVALIAARFGYLNILKTIEYSQSSYDINNTSTSSWAVAFGQNEVLYYLCVNGHNVPQEIDHFGNDVAHYAAITGNVEAISILNEHCYYGYDGFDVPDKLGRSPFMLALLNGHIDIIKTMLNFGWKEIYQHNFPPRWVTDKLITDNNDMCALQLASMVGNYTVIDYLIKEAGFDINRQNKYGETALLIAAKYGQITTLDYILSKSSSLDSLDCEGNSALMLASKSGNIYMVNHLLENTKVEINRKNKKHQTALSLALVYQNNKVAEILTKHGAKI